MLKNDKLRSDQQGFASIVIALVLIIVLALITVGFAQLARREQQDALNKQLSNQASYTAETGINDVYNAIYGPDQAYWQGLAASGSVKADTCLTTAQINKMTGYTGGQNSSSVDSGTGTSYSCILLNLAPTTITGTGLAPGTPDDFPFAAADASAGGTIKTLTVSWQSSDNHRNYNKDSQSRFLPSGNWNPDGPPLLQFSLTPVAAANVSRSDLINDTYVAYLYPSSSPASCSNACSYTTVISGGGQAPILDGNCTPPPHAAKQFDCAVTITDLPAGVASYDARVLGFYDSYDISIGGTEATGTTASFTGQSVIDVTAKAKNVLKRIRVVTSPQSSNSSSDSNSGASGQALEGAVCKRQQTAPTDPTYNPNGTAFIAPSGAGDDAACDLSTNN